MNCDRCDAEVEEYALILASNLGGRAVGVIELCEECADSFDDWFLEGGDETTIGS